MTYSQVSEHWPNHRVEQTATSASIEETFGFMIDFELILSTRSVAVAHS